MQYKTSNLWNCLRGNHSANLDLQQLDKIITKILMYLLSLILLIMIPKENEATHYWQNFLPWRLTHWLFFLSEAADKPICRGKNKELLPIDEKEFLTVSKLVRGRAKLNDVNKVHVYKWIYERLYTYLNCKERYELRHDPSLQL